MTKTDLEIRGLFEKYAESISLKDIIWARKLDDNKVIIGAYELKGNKRKLIEYVFVEDKEESNQSKRDLFMHDLKVRGNINTRRNRKVLFLVNPRSGKGKAPKVLS